MRTASWETIFRPILERLEQDLANKVAVPSPVIRAKRFEERPFSYILQVEIRSGSRPVLFDAYVKVFKPKPLDGGEEKMRHRVAHEFEVTNRVFAALSRHPKLAAVRPLACYPEHLALVTEAVTGRTLLEHLRGEATWFPSAQRVDDLCITMTTIAEWIRAFQATEPPAGTASLDLLRDYVDARLKRLVREPLAAFSEGDRWRVLKHMDRLSEGVDSSLLMEVPVHGDLAPGNIIINGARVAVLDFAMARAGNVFQDVSRLVVQVELLMAKPIFRKHVIERLTAALMTGFDQHLTLESPLFRLMLMRHRVNHLATLCSAGGTLPARAYQLRLRHRHRAWIEDEVRAVEQTSTR